MFYRMGAPAALVIASACLCGAADWPMWRGDAGRTGMSAERLPQQLHLKWARKCPPLIPAFPAARQARAVRPRL